MAGDDKTVVIAAAREFADAWQLNLIFERESLSLDGFLESANGRWADAFRALERRQDKPAEDIMIGCLTAPELKEKRKTLEEALEHTRQYRAAMRAEQEAMMENFDELLSKYRSILDDPTLKEDEKIFIIATLVAGRFTVDDALRVRKTLRGYLGSLEPGFGGSGPIPEDIIPAAILEKYGIIKSFLVESRFNELVGKTRHFHTPEHRFEFFTDVADRAKTAQERYAQKTSMHIVYDAVKRLAEDLAVMTIPGAKSRIRRPDIKVSNLDEIVDGIDHEKRYSKEELKSLLGEKVGKKIWNKEKTGDYVKGKDLYDALTIEFPGVHQLVGLHKGEELKRLLIADQAGTGKTAQAVLMRPYLHEKTGNAIKTVIVCPKNMVQEWKDRMHVYLNPDSEYSSAVPIEKYEDIASINGTNTVIVNYEKLSCTRITKEGIEEFLEAAEEEFTFKADDKEAIARRDNWNKERVAEHVSARIGEDVKFRSLKEACRFWAALDEVQEEEKIFNKLLDWGYNTFILDEGHMARNPQALRTKAVMKLAQKAEWYFELTATPAPRSLDNLARTVNSLIGTFEEGTFKPKISVEQFESTFTDPGYLGNVLREHMVRRTLPEVDSTFEKTKLKEDIVWVDFSGNPKQRKAYIEVLRDNSLNGGTKLYKLMRLALDPQMVGVDGPSVKYDALFERLECAVQKGRLPLVYCTLKDGVTRRDEIDPQGRILIQQLEDRFDSVAFIDGNTPERERRRIRAESNAGEIEVLLVTAQAMPYGVDLSGRDEIHHLNVTFLPDERYQQDSRVLRRGQEKRIIPSFVYGIRDPSICIQVGDSTIQGSIDEGILALHDERKFLSELIFAGAKGWDKEKLERLMGDDPRLLRGYLP